MNRCSSCRYFERASNEDKQNMFVHEDDGICKRFPLYNPKTKKEWCGEHKRKPTKKKEEKPKVNVGEVIAFYCEQFKEKFSIFPTILGKDKAATERMLKEHTIAEVNQSISDFFINTPQWNIDHSCYGLSSVEVTWDKRVISSAKLEVKTADDISYKDMLDEAAAVWMNHPRFYEYHDFILDTRELMTFEEFLKEYGEE